MNTPKKKFQHLSFENQVTVVINAFFYTFLTLDVLLNPDLPISLFWLPPFIPFIIILFLEEVEASKASDTYFLKYVFSLILIWSFPIIFIF